MSSLNTLIEKLSHILKLRFGVTLSFERLDSKQYELKERLLRESPLSDEGYWLFPVFSDHQMVGCARIHGLEDRPLSSQLSEFVELYLDSAVALTDQIELLDMIETQLRTSEVNREAANVIPLRRSSLTETIKIPATKALRRRSRVGFALPCLLEGLSHLDLKHLALELHELSGRYAFIYLEELTWTSTADLKGIGPVTLFVPEIATLTLQQQIALTEYLRSRPNVDEAHVVMCTLKPYAELRASGKVLAELLELVSVCYLKMDRPFREYRREGLLEFFFGSLIRDSKKDRLV